MKMEHTECSETLAYKIQMPGNYPEETIHHSEHSKILKSRSMWQVANLAIAYQMVSTRSGWVINKYLITKNPKILGKVSF
jgi:hypothetical protein